MNSKPTLYLRLATIEDAFLLFQWRNDEETRRYSLQREEITWQEHLDWLETTLEKKRSNRLLYIAELNEKPIGTIRADEVEELIELSWTISPEARGSGYGKKMVLKFVNEYFPHSRLAAKIEEGHIASEKIAMALGLKKIGVHVEETASRKINLWR